MEEAAVLFALGTWAERGCPALHVVHEQLPNPTRGKRLGQPPLPHPVLVPFHVAHPLLALRGFQRQIGRGV
jgi:hypothetical protein